MVNPQTCPIKELFNCLSVIQLVILSEAKNLGLFLFSSATTKTKDVSLRST